MAKVLFPVGDDNEEEKDEEVGSRSGNISSKQPSMKSIGASGGDHGAFKLSSPGIGNIMEPDDEFLSSVMTSCFEKS